MGFLDAFLGWGGIVLFALLLLGILIDDIVVLALENWAHRREREECNKKMVELADSLADSIPEGRGK